MKRRSRFLIIAIVVLAVGTDRLDAQSSLFQILGETRKGTASATFLKIGVGARAMGMGEAAVATVDDATALYWNPAGADAVLSADATVSHISWVADINYEHAAAVLRLGGFGVVGLQFSVLHMDDMVVTDEYHPHGVQYADGSYRTFSYGDMMGGITFASRLIDRFSYGVTAKVISEKLDDLTMTGFLIDLGLLYRVGINNASIGMSLTHLGSDLAPPGTFTSKDVTGAVIERPHESFPPPTTFRLGISVDPYAGELHTVTTAFSVERPSDSQEIYRIGAEYAFMNTFYLRGGYNLNNRIEGSSLSGTSFGVGAQLDLAGILLRTDYAYTDVGELTSIQVLSLGFTF